MSLYSKQTNVIGHKLPMYTVLLFRAIFVHDIDRVNARDVSCCCLLS